MNGHERTCRCLECLNALADAVDEMMTLAMAWQMKASWYGWDVREQPHWLGEDQSAPVIPINAWFLQFRQDAPRRELIRAKVAAVLEAEQLLHHT